jgi:hypothetical protein
MPFGVQLARIHSDYISFPTDFSKPWLTVQPSPGFTGRIVINKTHRYPNNLFPWKELVNTFSREMIFVGLESEHRDFCQKYGKVDYHKTMDMLDVAQVIAGSDLFIGNQSSPNAIAEGLKHNSIQEVCLATPDCVFHRANAIHCCDGKLEFWACGKLFQHNREKARKKIVRNVTPLGRRSSAMLPRSEDGSWRSAPIS